MAKDTIIPVKFEKELTTEEIEAFVDVIYDFAEAANMKMTVISMTAVKKRVEARDSEREQANELLPHVSGSALTDGDKMHYEQLQECCNKILDAVESGKVPQIEIMGLKLLMNR